jgi:hypothetical protein
MKNKKLQSNYKFLDSVILNSETYNDYFERLKKVALSIFEWENLPTSMDERYLEQCLFFFGKATLLKDKNYGFINTRCAGSGYVNIYGLPTKLNCYSYSFQSMRKLYTGINPNLSDKQKENMEYNECILVGNNWDFLPTASTIELFAYRLAEAEMTAFTNIKAQKTPVLIVVDEKQRLLMENLYNQYNGNQPFIFGDKNQLDGSIIKSITTEAPFIADKIMDYKKEIWNEALTYLGINNIMVEKKERMITDEANQNNELINLNLQSYLAPRQKACKDFNEKFGLTGTDKEISVRVRSDLKNIIKQEMSITNDFIDENENNIDDRIEGEE